MSNVIQFKKKQSPALLEFRSNAAKPIVSILQSGEVKIGEGYTADEAAKVAAEIFYKAFSTELLKHINGEKL